MATRGKGFWIVVALATLFAVLTLFFGFTAKQRGEKSQADIRRLATDAQSIVEGKVAGGVLIQGQGKTAPFGPEFLVKIDSFFMDLTEVTVGAYDSCVRANKCTAPKKGEQCNYGRQDRLTHPVNCVTHAQAVAFCAHRGRELPTESEWEYAARSTAGLSYVWGRSSPTDVPTCSRRPADGTCEVASFIGDRGPNKLYDQAANVSEWTATTYCPYDHPLCTTNEMAVRGASFRDVEFTRMLSVHRQGLAKEEARDDVGFRCIRRIGK